MALTDWELWACATATLDEHGEAAPTFVAERIGALVVAGDMDGVEAWKQIAARMDRIMRPGPEQ